MNIYEQDIFSQPDDLENAVRFYAAQDYYKKAAKLSAGGYDKIIMTGMGSSYSACMNAASSLRRLGISCLAQPTSQLLHYELDGLRENTLLVVVSQSGRSGEIVELMEKLRVPCKVIGITNDKNGPLEQRADLFMDMHVQPEQAVSTRTYLAPAVATEMLADAITGGSEEAFYGRVHSGILALRESIQDFFAMEKKLEDFLQLPPYVTLIGRGFDLCTVDAGALFIKEVAKYPSIPFDAGQFRHGPFEMLGENFCALIFATEGPGCRMQLGLAQDIAERGGKAVVITDSDEAKDSEGILVLRQRYASQELACLGNILPVQCFGNYIAKRKGLHVGEFLYGSKVTTVQ